MQATSLALALPGVLASQATAGAAQPARPPASQAGNLAAAARLPSNWLGATQQHATAIRPNVSSAGSQPVGAATSGSGWTQVQSALSALARPPAGSVPVPSMVPGGLAASGWLPVQSRPPPSSTASQPPPASAAATPASQGGGWVTVSSAPMNTSTGNPSGQSGAPGKQ